MNVTAVENSNLDLRYFESKKADIEIEVNEEESIDISKVPETKVDKDEARELYYASKANDLMKTLIQTYLDVEEEQSDFSFEDIREYNKTKNRADLLEYYQDEVRIQKDEQHYEAWA